MQPFQWQDRFNIGVDIVDQAHRRLFSIVQRIMELYVEKHENKFACVEGIKYFKAYALMLSETLSALERELYASDFSTEAVQHFIGVCTGWLTGHIMIEDRAITGKTDAASAPICMDDELSVIRGIILHPLQEMFGPEVSFIGRFSGKNAIRRCCSLQPV